MKRRWRPTQIFLKSGVLRHGGARNVQRLLCRQRRNTLFVPLVCLLRIGVDTAYTSQASLEYFPSCYIIIVGIIEGKEFLLLGITASSFLRSLLSWDVGSLRSLGCPLTPVLRCSGGGLGRKCIFTSHVQRSKATERPTFIEEKGFLLYL